MASKELHSDNGLFFAAQQGDGNFVVYRKSDGQPVWDMWGYDIVTINPPEIIIPPIPVIERQEEIKGRPIKLTDNRHKVNPIGMSYWRNINNHRGSHSFQVFLSLSNELHIFTVDKTSLMVRDIRSLGIAHTGEGCYFSIHRENILYVPINGSLFRVNIDTGDKELVWEVGGMHLWQCHSNYSENVHSATIQNESYQPKLWGVFTEAGGHKFFPIKGNPDECQIDKSGKYLLIKEDNYNRIIDLVTNDEHTISNEAGALGHSDCGFECALGENDFSAHGGALDCINFSNGTQRMVNFTGIWNMGYFSFTNAKPGDINSQYGLITSPNELIRVNLDNSMHKTVICSNLTESQEYEHRPKANLCPHGEFAIWTAFVNGRLDAYVVRVT